MVVDADGLIVGVVSRRDLLASFDRSDRDIRADVLEGVIGRWMLVDPASLRADVIGAVVPLSGTVDRRSDSDILTQLVRGLDGVVDVHSAVAYRWNDRDVGLAHELRL